MFRPADLPTRTELEALLAVADRASETKEGEDGPDERPHRPCALPDGRDDRHAAGELVALPGGLLAIETKSRRGKVSAEHVSEAWLKQAYAERKALERLVGVPVDALLVLSDAYIWGRPCRISVGCSHCRLGCWRAPR